jgi:hypothetical protein
VIRRCVYSSCSVKRFCQPSDRWHFQPRIQWKDMTSDEYEKLPAADREHFMQCPHCGETLSLEDVFLHVARKQRPNIR